MLVAGAGHTRKDQGWQALDGRAGWARGVTLRITYMQRQHSSSSITLMKQEAQHAKPRGGVQNQYKSLSLR